MFATGSYADHVELTYRLGEYEQAERIATLMGNGTFGDIANKAHERLTQAALRCGHNLSSSTDTVISFAQKRAARFAYENGGANQ